MDHVAALAETLQVALPVVARIMIEMRRRQDDAGLSERHRILDIRPSYWPAPTITPRVARGVEPTTIGQATDSLTMRPTASLADATSALEAHASADLRPVDRVEPAQLTLDRQSSPLFTMESVYRRFCRSPAIVANLIRRGKQPRPLLPRANAGLVQVFNATETGTADWVSRTLGDTTETYETGSQGETQQWNRFGAGSSSTAAHVARRASSVRRPPADSQILFKAGASSIFARKLRYYADPEFRGLFDAATDASAASGKRFHGYEASYHHRSR